MERKKFYDEIYANIIRSIREFEDGDISERYGCLFDYFLGHEDIISQYSTFDFSNERCFDKSALDHVAKRLLPKDCHALFPVFTKGDGNCLYGSIYIIIILMKMKINMDHTDTLHSFDTIIQYVLLYFKCLGYRILFSICSDSQLDVGLNARCKINRMLDDGDISQHQKNKFYNSARAFYERAFKYALDNFPHSDELLKYAEVINWEHRKDATIDSITYFVQR